MDGHSTARGRLYYLLTLKIITGRLARAECGSRVEDLTPMCLNYNRHIICEDIEDKWEKERLKLKISAFDSCLHESSRLNKT